MNWFAISVYTLSLTALLTSAEDYRYILPAFTQNEQRIYISASANTSVSTLWSGDEDQCSLNSGNKWSCSQKVRNISSDEAIEIVSDESPVNIYSTIRTNTVKFTTIIEQGSADRKFVLGPYRGSTLSPNITVINGGDEPVNVDVFSWVLEENATRSSKDLVGNMSLEPGEAQMTSFPSLGIIHLVANSSVAVFTNTESYHCQIPPINTAGLDFVVGPLLGSHSTMSITILFANNTSGININVTDSSGNDHYQIRSNIDDSIQCTPGACGIQYDFNATVGHYIVVDNLTTSHSYMVSSESYIIVRLDTFGSTLPNYSAFVAPLDVGSNQARLSVPAIYDTAYQQVNFISIALPADGTEHLFINNIRYEDLQNMGNTVQRQVNNHAVITIQVPVGIHHVMHTNPYVRMAIFLYGYDSTGTTPFAYGIPATFPRSFSSDQVTSRAPVVTSNPVTDKKMTAMYAVVGVLAVLVVAGIVVIVLVFVRPDLFKMQKGKAKKHVPSMLPNPDDMNRTVPNSYTQEPGTGRREHSNTNITGTERRPGRDTADTPLGQSLNYEYVDVDDNQGNRNSNGQEEYVNADDIQLTSRGSEASTGNMHFEEDRAKTGPPGRLETVQPSSSDQELYMPMDMHTQKNSQKTKEYVNARILRSSRNPKQHEIQEDYTTMQATPTDQSQDKEEQESYQSLQ